MKTLIALSFAALAAAACSSDHAVATEDGTLHVLVAEVGGGNDQAVEVDRNVPQALRVFVRVDGQPRSGIVVHWTSSAGTIPDSSVSDRYGIATASWKLGTHAGQQTATGSITVESGFSTSVQFKATALAGQATSLTAVSGDQQLRPMNLSASRAFSPVVVRVADRFGNPTTHATVSWTIDGPVHFLDTRSVIPPDANGNIVRQLGYSAEQGASRIRATLQGTTVALEFAAVVGAPEYNALLTYDYDAEDYDYGSDFNYRFYDEYFSFPPTHTIKAGSTFRWENRTGKAISIVSTGNDTFPSSGQLPARAFFSLTFDRPGTYTYAAPGYPRATGTIIVTP